MVLVCKDVGSLAMLTKAIIKIRVFSMLSLKWKMKGPFRRTQRDFNCLLWHPFLSFFFFFFLFCPEDVSCCCLERGSWLFLGMLISRLSSFQSPGLAGSIFQDLPGGTWGPFVSPARNIVLGKWQELWKGFLTSIVVSLAFRLLIC